MSSEINQVSIFLPVLASVALSIIAFLRMAVSRTRAVKERTDGGAYYRAFLGDPEPEYAVVAVRHYGNLFETPVLLYTASLLAFAIGAVTPWLLLWAWGYVIARLVQSAVHLTFNNPAYRGLAFVVSWLFMIATWVTLAMAVFARL